MSARTRSGRLRGRPTPIRGTRIASRTGLNCGESPRWQAVITTDSGFCPCSTARWILLVRPPRDRPSPWSAGSTVIPPGGSFWRSPFSPPGGVLMGSADRRVDVHVPGDQAPRVRLSLEPGDNPSSGAVPLPTPEEVADAIPRAVPLGHIPPRGAGPSPPPYAVYQLSPSPHRRTARLDALRQQRLEPGLLSIRKIPTSHRR